MKSRQEETDHLMRQRLLEADPAPGDWDLPSGDVWNAVARRIQPGKKRRWAFWWILAGSMIVIIGILLFKLGQQDSPALKPANGPGQPLVRQEVSSGTQPISSEPVIHLQDQGNKKVDLSNPPGKSLKVPFRVDQHQNPTGKRNIKSAQDKLIHPQSILNDASIAPNEVVDNISYADDMITSPSFKVGSATEMTQSTSTPEDVPFLHQELSLVNTLNSSLPDVDVQPVMSGSRHASWSLVAALTPSLGTRSIVVPDAQPRVRRNLLLQQEEPAVQLGFGISAIRELSRRWSIGMGLEYSRFLLNSSSTHQIRYTHAGETLNARGNFENRFQLNLNTSYGELSTDVIVERSSDAQIEEHQFINLALQTRQSMQVLRLPVSARYQIPLRKWTMSCYGGFSANLLLENELEFRAVQSLSSEILQTKTLPNARLSSYRDFALGYQFGIGFEIPLDRQWSLLMGPSVSGYLQPVYRNRHVLIFPVMAEVQVGVRYRLSSHKTHG
ncbi:MAG TPA: hypothetical protein VI603_00815 [Saprospiraceae bacterium]|nr:hypothetical protein [Saprospiraceae bacterium]